MHALFTFFFGRGVGRVLVVVLVAWVLVAFSLVHSLTLLMDWLGLRRMLPFLQGSGGIRTLGKPGEALEGTQAGIMIIIASPSFLRLGSLGKA